jgi:hypothetical protein
MAKKVVMIEEVSKDMFVVPHNSPLIRIIEFGYILHSFMIDNGLTHENEWLDFSFGMNLKILDSHDEIVLFNASEVKHILEWLDWICRLVVASEGEHNNTKFIKNFISMSDKLFDDLKYLNIDEKIMIEKLK